VSGTPGGPRAGPISPDCRHLADHAVVVTGAGGYLGSAIAVGAAAAGARVLAAGRRSESLEATRERLTERPGIAGSLETGVADVGDDDSLSRLVEWLESSPEKHLGWVNCAVVIEEEPGPCQTREALRRAVDSALVDVIVATQAAAAAMSRRGGGSIVNVASMYGMVSPDPRAYVASPSSHNPPGYGAAKAGVIQHTRYAACHLAPLGIRVNCVSPGPFPNRSRVEEAFMTELAGRVPLGRIGEPEDLVGPVTFLLGPSSAFVTGHNLVVDGGWTAW
jgi:NAD(P)-dependent dehydrogenase (short-subunit alcohol dehydrogenase family)